MKSMAWLAALLLLCGCSESTDPESTTSIPNPVTTPIELGNQIRRDVEAQRAESQRREALFDEAVEANH